MGVLLLRNLDETAVPEPGWAKSLWNVAISWIACSHTPVLENEYPGHRAAAGGGHSKSAHKLGCRVIAIAEWSLDWASFPAQFLSSYSFEKSWK